MASTPVVDNEIAASDLGPLAWVLDELRKSLDGAAKALRRFVRDAELARGSDLTELDASHLRIARQQLHQAVGALEMVGLPAPAKVLRAMEALAQKYVQRPELCSDDAASKMERASFALTEYLEGVLKGKTASSVALFPQYRAVLELAGADRVHPADLWPPEWRWLEIRPGKAAKPLEYATEVRTKLDQSVLKVVKSSDTAAARRLSGICAGLATTQTTMEARTFWSIAAGFFEALSLELCALDGYTKRAASRVLQQYATLAKGDANVSERLAQDLLFFCAQSVPREGVAAAYLSAVRSTYGLTNVRAADYETEQFGRFDPALLVLARKRIASAAETWSALAGGDTNRLKVASEQFAAVADSVVKLHPECGDLAQALIHALDVTVKSGAAPAPAVAMEVATSVLYLEAAYEDIDPTESQMADRSARLAVRLRHVSGGGEPEPMEGWMEELYRRVSDRQTMGSVVDELRTALTEVEKSLDAFFRNPQDKQPLRDVPTQLAQMRGVFSVLGLDQPSLAALRMRSSVEQLMVDTIDEATARTGIFEKLGNSLGAMGFLIDMLSYQRSLAKKLFVYDEELGEFKPLMGRERVVVQEATQPAPVVPDTPLEPTQVLVDLPPSMQATVSMTVPVQTSPVQPAPAAVVAAPVAVEDEGEDDELIDIFLEEAREVVRNGLTAVKALAGDPSNLAEQTTLRRAFHTLKGSSRMVGLTDFGEAAWSFEQLLNTWLAEQRPASDELITVASSGMHAFGRWVEDIANHADVPWNVSDFRKTADGLRVDGQLIALQTPGASEAVEVVEMEMPAEEFASNVEQDLQPTTVVVIEEATPPEVVEFASTALVSSLSEPEPGAPLDFSSTQLVDSLDFGATPEPAEFVSTALVDSLRFEAPEPKNDFANTQLVSSLNAVPDEEEAQTSRPDFQPTRSFELDLPPEPAANEAAASLDLGDIDFGEAAPASEPAAQDIALDLPEQEPAVEELSAPEEQVKVIGPLRLSIPLYNVYLNEADEWSRRLQTELNEWALELHKPVSDSVVALAHSLLGSSATVGFVALSEMARALEHALQHVQLHRQGSPELAQVFNNAAEDIRRLLHQFAAGFLKDADEATLAALQTIIETEFPAPTMESDSAYTEAAVEQHVDTVLEAELAASVEELDILPEEAVPTQAPEPDPVVAATVVAAAPAAVAAPLRVVRALDDDLDAVDQLDEDLFPIFEEEATELMPQLGTALRQWVSRPDNLGARNEILRVLHTLKGSARLAGAMRLGEMSHRMESGIEELGTEALQAVQLEPLLAAFDALQNNFDRLGKPVEEEAPAAAPAASVASVEAKTADTSVSKAVVAAPVVAHVPLRQSANQSVRVRSQLLDRLVNQAGEVMITRSRMDARLSQLRTSLDELTGNLDRLRQQLRDVELQAESQMQSRLAQTKESAQSFDPLEFDRFTRVQELTRMMAESVNDVATVQRNLQRSIEGAEDDLIAQGRQARELQRDLLRTRMVEFEGISDRLYGVVRQASKDAGKQVKLEIIGGSIEMDRGVLDRMAPAFEHMLRNSVAHGIEEAAVRVAAGKSAVGSITIRVNQESNDVSVSFSDDGGGLHLDKIRAKAIANGVIQANDALSDGDAANLIFMPGFSTAEHVTELAGRGIGMDVVRSEVNSLGGRIETTTEAGQGSTFKVILPLTTAVTQVVMMRMGEFTIGVPSNLMQTVLRVPGNLVEQSYQRDGFDFGGEIIPFFWAGALLQVSSHSHELHTKTLPVAVFRSAGQRMALHVDEVLGNREVVVKNLGPQLARLPGLAGMSVLASGAVVLIYNPVALAAVYGDQARQLRMAPDSPAAGDAKSATVMAASVELPLVLVVDDSITVRRVTQRLLKREGYRVTLAADGLQALEKLQEERPAVVLSDIEMPRMDGFDLTRNIRGDDKLKDLPIIMITSRIAEKHREHARELGVDHYLGKPYSEDELLGLVRGYCTAPSESADS